jgi:hypothetical protein
MTNDINYTMLRKTARIAGLWYLLMLITAPIGLMYIPSKLFISGNATATASNVMTSELLFRIGIMSNLICQISFIFLVLALYRLFKGVNEKYAKLMVSLVIVAVPIAFLNELTQIATILIYSDADYLKVFEPNQLNGLAMLFLNLHEQGTFIVGIFWGLWLFPFGYLVIKSGFIPKVLGILLIIGCFSYLIDSSVALLIPQQKDFVTNILMLPLAFGELSMILWLLIKGVKTNQALMTRK